MSWGEVKKINSNFSNESLNYNNYLTDIATYGADSYIMNVHNKHAFRDFISNSLALWGYEVARNYLYIRLDNDDLDYMVAYSPKLGQCLNARIREVVFEDGNIDTILKTMTVEKFNKLDGKFKDAIKRYITLKTNGDEVGPWLKSVFNIDRFGNTTNMVSILSDSELWTSVATNNESVMWLISHSTSGAVFAADSNIPITVYESFITRLSANKDKMVYFFKKLVDDDRITNFFENSVLCDRVIASTESMKALVRVSKAFEAFLRSDTAAPKIRDSEATKAALMKGVADSVATEKVLRENKLSNTTLKTKLNEINNLVELSNYVEEAKISANDVSNKIDEMNALTTKATEHVDIILSAMLNNQSAMEYAMNNTDAFRAWIDNETAMRNVAESSIAIDAIKSNPNTTNAVYNSFSAIRAILGTSNYTFITDNSTPVNKLLSNNNEYNKILDNKKSIYNIFRATNSRNLLGNNSTLLSNTINSPLFNTVLNEHKDLLSQLVSNTNIVNVIFTNTNLANLIVSDIELLKIINSYSNASSKLVQSQPESIKNIINNSNLFDVIVGNTAIIQGIISNSNLLNYILNNLDIMRKISNNASAAALFISDNNSFNKILSNSTLNGIFNSSNIAINYIAGNSTYLSKVANTNNTNIMTTILNNSAARSTIANSTSLTSIIANNSNSMSILVNNRTILNTFMSNRTSLLTMKDYSIACDILNNTSYNDSTMKSLVSSALTSRTTEWSYSTSGDDSTYYDVRSIPSGIYILEGSGEYLSHDYIYINRTGYSSETKKKMGTNDGHYVHFGSGYIKRYEDSSRESSYELIRLS